MKRMPGYCKSRSQETLNKKEIPPSLWNTQEWEKVNPARLHSLFSFCTPNLERNALLAHLHHSDYSIIFPEVTFVINVVAEQRSQRLGNSLRGATLAYGRERTKESPSFHTSRTFCPSRFWTYSPL